MVYFKPIGGPGSVTPLGAGSGSLGASPASQVKTGGVDAFTPSFGLGSSSGGSSSSVADIIANVGKLSADQARGQLSGGTNAGLDSFSKIHQAF